MNRQASYIAQAHLILAGIAATFWVISKIPSTASENDRNESINTINANRIVVVPPEIQKGKNLFQNKI
jgi:hypothetical protein